MRRHLVRHTVTNPFVSEYGSRFPLVIGLLAVLLCCCSDRIAQAEESEGLQVAKIQHDGPVDFEKEILPLLRRSCLACHSASQAESELVLETPQTILSGGSQGPAVVPGKPDESLLLILAAHRDEPVMPPEDNSVSAKNFTADELGLLQLWIEQGAKGSVNASEMPIQWHALPESVKPIYAVAITPDGRLTATGRANRIDLYQIASRSTAGHLVDVELAKSPEFNERRRAHQGMVESLAFSPDGEWLASGSFREVKLWRRPHHFPRRQLAAPAGEVRSLSVSKNHKWAAAGDVSGRVRRYDLKSSKAAVTLNGHTQAVTGIVFTPDASRVITASLDRTVRVWEVASGKMVGAFETPSPVTAMTLDLKLQQIVTGGEDGIGRTFALPKETIDPAKPVPPGVVLKELTGSTRAMTSLVSTSADSGQVIAGSLDGQARLWDVASGKLLKTLDHGAPILSLAVREDAKQAATGSNDGSAKLWDLESGKIVADLAEDLSSIGSLEVSQYNVALSKQLLLSSERKFNKAEKQTQEKQKALDLAAVELAQAEVSLKAKTAASQKTTAEMTAAKKTLDTLKTELAHSQEKLKTLEADTPAADDQAEKKTHAEKLKKLQAEIAAFKPKLEAAEKEVTRTSTAADKANDEQTSAELAVKASERTFKEAEKRTAQARAELPELLSRIAERQQDLTSAQLAVENLKRTSQQRAERIRELREDQKIADQSVVQLKKQLHATPATSEEKAAAGQPLTKEQLAAQTATIAAEVAVRKVRELHRNLIGEKQKQLAALTLKKAVAAKTSADAVNRNKAAIAARGAADKPIPPLEEKVKSAKDDDARKVANVELQNAIGQRDRLQDDVLRTTAAVKKAQETQANLEKELTKTQEQLKAVSESSAQALKAVQTQWTSARAAQQKADRAVAGTLSELATAISNRQRADAALANVQPPITALTFSPDGKRLLVSDLNQVREYSSLTGDPVEVSPVWTPGVISGVFLNDREWLTVASDRSLNIENTVPAWKLEKTIGHVDSPSLLINLVTAIDFSPDGTLLATGGGEASRSGEIKLWDVATGALVRTLENPHSDVVLGLDFSPNGKFLASSSADRFMKVFDVATGELVKTFEGHTHHVLGVSWRADGDFLATAGADKICKVWDFETAEAVRTIAGYKKEVTAVQYLGVTDTFITSSGLTNQVIIKKGDGKTGPAFPGTADFIYCVRASRDGETAVAGGQRSLLHVWKVKGIQGTLLVDFPPPDTTTTHSK